MGIEGVDVKTDTYSELPERILEVGIEVWEKRTIHVW